MTKGDLLCNKETGVICEFLGDTHSVFDEFQWVVSYKIRELNNSTVSYVSDTLLKIATPHDIAEWKIKQHTR